MLECLWINHLPAELKKTVISAREKGVKVKYNMFLRTVFINYGPLFTRLYNAKTGEIITMS
jgi:hypothetical protein